MSLWDLNKEIEVLVQEHQEGSGVGPSFCGWVTTKHLDEEHCSETIQMGYRL